MAIRPVQCPTTKADLINFSSAQHLQTYLVLDESTTGDRDSRIYYYDSSATATADGELILSADGMAGVGRYIKERLEPPKRIETYQGTTDAAGNFSVTYTTSFPVTPHVDPELFGATDTQAIRITASTTTGFTVNVRNRTDVLGLLPSYSNVPGASVSVLVIER